MFTKEGPMAVIVTRTMLDGRTESSELWRVGGWFDWHMWVKVKDANVMDLRMVVLIGTCAQ